MIPASINIGASWNVLPPGIHDATLEEIGNRFAINERRKKLYAGFCDACKSLRKAGCRTLYLDGSYISDKPNPGDYDVCWDPLNVDSKKINPVFFDFTNRRINQKDKYGGEFFPSSVKADGKLTFLEFFKIDKETGSEKGIIRVQL